MFVLRLCACLALLLTLVSGSRPKERTRADNSRSLSRPALACPEQTELTARNVIVHEYDQLSMRVFWMRASMCGTREGRNPSLDDPASFSIRIDDGQLGLRLADLSALINTHKLIGSSLSNVQLSVQGEQLRIAGTLHKIVPFPVEALGTVGVASGGSEVVLHIGQIHVLKMPVSGLLNVLRIKAQDLIDLKHAKGIRMAGDDLFINPVALLPAPKKTGKLTAVRLSGDGELIEIFGNPNPPQFQDKAHNFIRLSGGTVELGKIVMSRSDILVADSSPSDWFHFDLAHYAEQLVNGRTQLTAKAGLEIFVPDYTRIPQTPINRRIDAEWAHNRVLHP